MTATPSAVSGDDDGLFTVRYGVLYYTGGADGLKPQVKPIP